MGSLGKPRNVADLSYLTQPGKADKVESENKPNKHINVDIVKSDRSVITEPKAIEPDDVVMFSIRIKASLVDRVYSEKFHDPEQRSIQDVVQEILVAGLSVRPDKGPAPAQFIAALKSKGKRKKS